MKIAILDTETTGLERGIDHVIDVCLRNYDDTQDVKYWRVRPPIPIPQKISEIHGIYDKDVFHSPSFGEMADEIGKEISKLDVIVGYNPDFDVEMLRHEFKLAVVDVRWPKTIVCAKRLWDIHDPKKRALVDAYAEFVSPDGFQGAHGALADTLATGKVLAAQLAKFQLTDKSWAELDPERANWCGPSHHVTWISEELVINFGKHAGKTFAEVDGGYLHFILKDPGFPRHVKDMATQAQKLNRERTDTHAKSVALAVWARGQGL